MAGPCPKFGGEMHLKFQHPSDSCQTLPETEPEPEFLLQTDENVPVVLH